MYYTVCDDGFPSLCDTGLVIINVFHINIPPDAVTDLSSVLEDSSVTLDLLFNDSDPDGLLDTTTCISVGF